jgi:hypothetical protein
MLQLIYTLKKHNNCRFPVSNAFPAQDFIWRAIFDIKEHWTFFKLREYFEWVQDLFFVFYLVESLIIQ